VSGTGASRRPVPEGKRKRKITVKETEATVATCAAERRSKVSFDIEPDGDQVKLTVIHDDFGPDSTVLGLISGGWPWKLSNLKTALEQP